MASCNWEKQTKQKAGAMKRHNSEYQRENGNHANKDIDKKLSHLNLYIGCDDYDEAYSKMCKRVAEVDAIYPPKRIAKDRIVCESIVTPCPQAIFDMGKSDDFFNNVHKALEEFFGAENVNGTCVHYDEIHDYINENGEKTTSLAHSHSLITAYTEWQEPIYECKDGKRIKEPVLDKDGNVVTDKKGNQKLQYVQSKDKNGNLLFQERKGVNGRHFEILPRYNALNRKIDAMCRERYGVSFLNGKGGEQKSVEILKAETELREVNAELVKQKSIPPRPEPTGVLGKIKSAEWDKKYAIIDTAQSIIDTETTQKAELDKQRDELERGKAELERGFSDLQTAKQNFQAEKKEYQKTVNTAVNNAVALREQALREQEEQLARDKKRHQLNVEEDNAFIDMRLSEIQEQQSKIDSTAQQLKDVVNQIKLNQSVTAYQSRTDSFSALSYKEQQKYIQEHYRQHSNAQVTSRKEDETYDKVQDNER